MTTLICFVPPPLAKKLHQHHQIMATMEASKCAKVMGTHHCEEKALLAMAGNTAEDKGRDREGKKQRRALMCIVPPLSKDSMMTMGMI
jgi:hypothetical protein